MVNRDMLSIGMGEESGDGISQGLRSNPMVIPEVDGGAISKVNSGALPELRKELQE